MLFSAYATAFRPDWQLARQVLVAAGATLFFISDGMLAWNRFVRPMHLLDIGVVVTYHLAQLILAASIGASGA